MNDQNKTQPLTVEIVDSASEKKTPCKELHFPLNETAKIKDVLLINNVEYQNNSIARQLHNFQEWKLRLTDKNSLHFGISFFI